MTVESDREDGGFPADRVSARGERRYRKMISGLLEANRAIVWKGGFA